MCVWLYFKKFSGKYFLVFGKEGGKHKPKKTSHNPEKSRSRRLNVAVDRDLATARSRVRDLAVDASRDRAVDRDLDPARSREREIAVVGLVAENGFGMEDKDQQQNIFLVICFLGFGIFFFLGLVWFE